MCVRRGGANNQTLSSSKRASYEFLVMAVIMRTFICSLFTCISSLSFLNNLCNQWNGSDFSLPTVDILCYD